MITSVSQTQNINTGKEKYKDPLNQPAAVLFSYSNEIGTAIYEIAPKLGTALWAPTFMYLGADIYDKYKNDKDNYNPSAKRAFNRTIYQALTSIVGIPAAIILGKYIISPLGKLDKTGISGNAKDAVYRHTRDVISQVHGIDLGNETNFKKIINSTLENKIKSRKNEKKTINIFSRIYNKLFTTRYHLLNESEDKILKFADKNAEQTFRLLKALKNDDRKNIPSKIYKTYQKVLPTMKETYNEADYSYQATRHALMEYQTSLIFKNKLIKTFSGLAVLLLMAKPINDFVDKQIMKKVITPGIDQLMENTINNSKLKDIFNNLNKKHEIELKQKTNA